MRLNRILSIAVLITFFASQFFLVSNNSSLVGTAFACYSWQVGARIGLIMGSEIRTGSGLNYQVHTIVPEENWQVDIIGGPRNADGKDWWDISRQNLDGGGTGWIYKEQAGYDLCGNPPTDPGRVELVDNLSLRSDGSGQWPPMVGDKLVAHIKVRNGGGQTISLEKIGVRGRKNGIDFWDIGWWSADLGSGQEWQHDPNNERALEAGNYSFRISYKDNSGWHEIGSEINFTVGATPLDPGQINLTENLSLQSNGSEQWPPVVGDKLVAHIKVRNSGGQTLNLENIGVRGWKNGSENWDIGWWSVELGPGQAWKFDPNNERALEAGTYSFRVSYKDNSGWHEIGNEVNFSVSSPGDLELTEVPITNQTENPNSSSIGQWQVGARVGLCAGAQIRSGSGFSYSTQIIVPENNWKVDIIDGPRNLGGVTWWNISRKNIDDGGTGWVYFEQASLAQCNTLSDTPRPIGTVPIPQIETLPLPQDGTSFDSNFWCFLPNFCVQAAVNISCSPQCVVTARKNRDDLVLWSGAGTPEEILAIAATEPKFTYNGQKQQVRVRAKGESPQAGDLVIWMPSSMCKDVWTHGHIGNVTSGNPFRISDSNWGDLKPDGSCATRTDYDTEIKSCMKFITSPYLVGVESTPQQVEPALQQPVNKCSQYIGLRWVLCFITGR